MLLELHAHTSTHSRCSRIDPVTLVRLVIDKGLQGLVITEHHYLWTAGEIAELRIQSGAGNHFLILAGQEVDTDIGHILVFGAEKSIEDRTSLRDLKVQFPDAAFVWAHPFRNGAVPDDPRLVSRDLDAAEIFSLNQTAAENYRGLKKWHNLKFTATAGSDTHSSETAGGFPTQFDHPVFDITALVNEIKSGRCRPFFKEIPKSGGNISVMEITIGTKGSDETRSRIIVKHIPDEKKWEKTRKSAGITAKLYSLGFAGKMFRVPAVVEIDEKERMLIEEGQRGNLFYDVISAVDAKAGAKYLKLAGEWLARLHNLKLKEEGEEDAEAREEKRFENYLKHFSSTSSPYLKEAAALIGFVKEREEKLFRGESSGFVRIHGDYHPKNIIIGRDLIHDPGTLYISVIDFGSSIIFDPAFDAGYFLAQFRHQMLRLPGIYGKYREKDFIDAYLKAAQNPGKDFADRVSFFRIRANLSIASFLIQVGKGESAEMAALIKESARLRIALL